MIKTIMQPVKPHSNKRKVSDLTNKQLDWAVSSALGATVYISKRGDLMTHPYGQFNHHRGIPRWIPSSSWEQGGPIIEKEKITLEWTGENWCAYIRHDEEEFGTTPLVAAMRCYVVNKIGDEVLLPGEML